MKIQENQSLKIFNTFGIDVSANYFVEASTLHEIREALAFVREKQIKLLILNGGSNILFTQDFDGLVLKINLKGIDLTSQNDEFVYLTVQAGEKWHNFVRWALEKDFGGLENLSLIPGNAGTAPMQNIGAYGMEVKDVITELSALEISTTDVKKFSNEECQFGYRESVFKNELKNQFIILDVTFKLTKINHQLHTNYGAIQSELENLNIQNPTIQDISTAVISIRQSKLPDPKVLGNSGSFFKNPLIPKVQFDGLKIHYPTISGYQSGEQIKVAAGWLIEQAGWKGKRFGDAGVHEKQALVLVNYGNATGKEIYELSQKIVDDVKNKFGIVLEREVNIL